VAKPDPKKPLPGDAVSEFLAKAEQQETEERAAEKAKDSPSVRAAHKKTPEAIQRVDESIEENPIAMITAMRNPGLVEAAHHEDLESMARGEDSLVQLNEEP